VNKINFLLLSDSKDFTTDYISLELEKRKIKYLRLDRDLLPNYKITWDINEQKISINKHDKKYQIDEISLKGVYYRAPTYLRETFSNNKSIEEQLQQSQWMSFYRNLLCFNNAKWINNPSSTFYAENKMVQLKVAKEVGFKIPKTIVANNSNHIDVLNDSMIIKSLDTAIFNLGDSEAFVYTNSVDKVELEKAKISIAPIIIQDNLTPKIDYRITVIDNKVFSVKILINDKGVTGDWRKEKDNVNFVPVNLPDKINQMCCELVKNLGLSFGAIDLVCSEDTFYFIEVNPTGEWAWLVDSANQKIYEAICDSLIGNTHD
jgi:hypothetical protein